MSHANGGEGRSVSRAKDWLEVLTIVIMGLATIATAWSGYQAS
jgi:hypothetical protein